MKRWLPLVAAGGMVFAACTDSTQPSNPAAPDLQSVQGQQQQAEHVHIMLRKPEPGAKAHGGPGGGGGNTGIFYHGGPVLFNTKVAAIYWAGSRIYNGGPTPGSTGSGAQDGSLVGFFLRNLGGSPYFNINTTYYDGAGAHVQNSVTYTQFWADASGPASGTVSDAQVQQEVVAGLNSGALSYDPSTLYVVFSAPTVNLGGGFGTQYCAYHGHFSSGYGDVKYAVLPYDWSDPSGCAWQTTTPNDDPAADTEVNVLAHETEETTTDEDLNAWYDRRGYENADKCAWTFGTTYTTANGSIANMNLGGKDFLVQRNWVNAGRGGCYVQWP
jgi:Phosphate-induced protein 1 conserved region